ncbi:hypothetical protein LTR78_004618 [Recurvomyces mirabilis]|uniref:Uncharacterized protein n=1 Tax=Recurvomyces mirabilis TaxID=574656 RepID=A0AAE1C2H9_9PEZI|nr:hypothetical protein LTR78_004618 [Recurvomyces mirabilis]KAK5152888.1 hypothetical protein LTS14_007996 [Recurvomyces mirabilis]
MPARFGYDKSADYAVTALSNALQYNRLSSADVRVARAAFENYDNAVRRLRADLSCSDHRGVTDGTFICIAALSIYEMVMQENDPHWQDRLRSHWTGVNAVLRARRQSPHMSNVARGIVYSLVIDLTEDSMARGRPSDHLLYIDPPERLLARSANSLSLSKVTYQLIAQFPSLLNGLRAARYGYRENHEELDAVFRLAERLVNMSDDACESAILHATTVQKSTVDSKIVPFELVFKIPEDVVVAINYWLIRMATINGYLKLVQTHPHLAHNQEAINRSMAEKERYYTNMMMVWHQATLLGPFTLVRVGTGLLQNWQHLRRTRTWRGLRSIEVVAWVLSKLNKKSLAGSSAVLGPAEYDILADYIVGGPLEALEAANLKDFFLWVDRKA